MLREGHCTRFDPSRRKWPRKSAVLSFVRIYSAEIELAAEHFPHHVSNEVVGLAGLYLQLVQRNETPRAYADDRTEVVLTRIDR
jgi:hypothetical protein